MGIGGTPEARREGWVRQLMAAIDAYRPARQESLATLQLAPSNRDPPKPLTPPQAFGYSPVYELV